MRPFYSSSRIVLFSGRSIKSGKRIALSTPKTHTRLRVTLTRTGVTSQIFSAAGRDYYFQQL
jgi:hypothetical protein